MWICLYFTQQLKGCPQTQSGNAAVLLRQKENKTKQVCLAVIVDLYTRPEAARSDVSRPRYHIDIVS